MHTRREVVKVSLPRLLTDDIDVLVTMPVPKLHMNSGVSLTFKNQWGCISQPTDRLRAHPYFSEVVMAVNQAVKAKYAVIDGRFGLDRSGPLRGDPIRLDWVAVSSSLGAGAVIACELMGVPLQRIEHLRYARELGLVPDLEEIEFNTEWSRFAAARPFRLRRHWTDIPGYLAFRSAPIAHLAYFSRWAKPLHRLLYLFREPFYDYDEARERRVQV